MTVNTITTLTYGGDKEGEWKQKGTRYGEIIKRFKEDQIIMENHLCKTPVLAFVASLEP